MTDREIGVGIVGFGLGGRVFHAPFVNAVTGLRLAAILQRKGDEAAKAFPAARIVRSLDEMLADKTIELVVVTTPNATHFELAKQHGGLPLRHSVIRAEDALLILIRQARAAAVHLGLQMFIVGEAVGEDDASFAGDPAARLDFFYQRHASWDRRFGLYPVARAMPTHRRDSPGAHAVP